ncbi:YegJ family protein [Roseovarius aestuarii]|uniref:DUF2314 domain-containing protein n=2 Tax=Roseovarius aestuarii TaxID=475083 RepID=A0A1X7BWV3_9RHOB|nr:DUF2314 domain-containing protein [Roseovarius aestuarii]SMC14121.1 hypothetical protein ROA7745_03986 [Roseovarius aestuarii]
MAYGFPIKRMIFWGGLAAVIWAGQQMGLLSSSQSAAVAGTNSSNNVIQVPTADQSMQEALETARASLPTFLEAAANAPASWQTVTIKVALEGETQIENIWVADFHQDGADQYRGRLSNDPVDLPGMKAGDEVQFSYAQIKDWAFVEDGRGYGFYSVRAMLPMMDEAQANGMRAFLAEDPLPKGW